MNNYNYNKLTPFKWFILENFPLIDEDFDALTNWQLFCKLGKEINKIINSQNNVGEQMENVTNAFIALQDYVDNYFDNLDVQEEINNKLDDMAESGELEDIIATYLATKAIFGFDTLNDLKNAENLNDGSYARTLGKESINDGYGALYKIREITNTDIVDNKTIISLNNSNTLIAELIINNIENSKALLCLTKVYNGSNYDVLLSRSYDGINFGNLLKLNGVTIPNADHNIAVNFEYLNNKFYVLTSNGYWFSDDLITWSTFNSWDTTKGGAFIYNNELYYHYRESDDIIVNDMGYNTYAFSIKKCSITFNNDGTITAGEPITLLQGDNTHSYIDPYLVKFNNTTYFACKEELKCIIKLYTINNTTLTDTNFSHRGYGIEAPKLIPNGSALYIYADPYGLQTLYENTTNVSYDRSLSVRLTAITEQGVNTDALLTPVYNTYEYHPAFNLIDDLNAIRLIDTLKYTPMRRNIKQFYKQIILSNSTSNEIISVINHPLRPLFITGNTANKQAYLRFTQIFEYSPLLLRLDPTSGTNLHPAQGVNGKTDTTSNENIIKQHEVITAPLYVTGTNTFVFIPVEQYEFRRQLTELSNTKNIQTSLNENFLKGNTVNFFIINGYGSDISVNKLPTASNFFGQYYKQSNNFGHLILTRIGDAVIEYHATISSGTLSSWVQTLGT